MADPGGSTGIERGPFFSKLINQFKLKYIYRIQISAIDSTTLTVTIIIFTKFYYPSLILALANASAGENAAQLIISWLFCTFFNQNHFPEFQLSSEIFQRTFGEIKV